MLTGDSPSPFGLTPSQVLSILPPIAQKMVGVGPLRIELTWEANMDTTVEPAMGSWNIEVNGVPKAVIATQWTNPLLYRMDINAPWFPADTVTLNFPASDAGLRTAAHKIVEPFDLGVVPV